MREVISKAHAAREDEQNAEDRYWPGSLHTGRRDSTRGVNGRLQKKREAHDMGRTPPKRSPLRMKLLLFRRVLHFHRHAHPGVNAALKVVLAESQPRNLKLAALQDAGTRNVQILEPAVTLRNGLFTVVETLDEAATELLYLREGMRFAALIDDHDRRSFVDAERIWFEIPSRVRRTVNGLFEKLVERSKCAERYVLAKIRAERVVEAFRLAFIEGDDLDGNGSKRWRRSHFFVARSVCRVCGLRRTHNGTNQQACEGKQAIQVPFSTG